MNRRLASISTVIGLSLSPALHGDASAAGDTPESGSGRELRYHPEGTDFVIRNGREFFNRALYGGNAGFRVEAGDRPEFAFYLPGRGGNLRVGLVSTAAAGGASKWLHEANEIVARYRAGSMVYEIRDPMLGEGMLTLAAIPLAGTEGLVVRAVLDAKAAPVNLVWAFGGANGDRGRRGGDLRGERDAKGNVVSLGTYFQLKPEYCEGNTFTLRPDGFTLTAQAKVIPGLSPQGSKLPAEEAGRWARPTDILAGWMPPGAKLVVADAARWGKPADLLASAGRPTATPVMAGVARMLPGTPIFLGIQHTGGGQPALSGPVDLKKLYDAAESHRVGMAGRLGIETPDPYINAAAAAVGVAADAVWDNKHNAFMHGAIAWRIKLLGWRAPYAGDALGWHERTRAHFSGFAAQQDTSPVPAAIPPADEKFNLSRNEAALHTNGNMTRTHYDMNLVAVDVFFRHLMWTGDLGYAEEMWPVIERHLAWQRRLFRRPFGEDKLPLYEAYCCIWASDELFYNGGGVTHATAYNYWHNLMAARLAKLLRKDPAPYEKEAALIRAAMRRELWLADRGWFAEFKDFLGLQSVHPSAAVWTFYHTLDSAAATPMEAWQMSRFVDTRIPVIPMRGPGVPDGNFTVATTNWMPYMWSINNITLEESGHTALAYWQAGRADHAFPLFKGCLLDSMFMGTTPGNVGMTSLSDKFSNETYRDFADSVGVTARALVEGLFGIAPDQLAGEQRIRPGFPADWDKARIRHPGVAFAFKREGLKESFIVESSLPKPMALRLEIAAPRDGVGSVIVNGKPAAWRALPDSVGIPRVAITAPPAARQLVVVEWKGNVPSCASAPAIIAQGAGFTADTGTATPLAIEDPQGVLKEPVLGKNEVKAVATGMDGHRTAFVQVKQGELTWWQPLAFELRPAYEIVANDVQDGMALRFRLRNNMTSPVIAATATARAGDKGTRQSVTVDALADSPEIILSADGLLPGSNTVTVDCGNGARVDGVVVNWKLKAAGTKAKLEPVDLAPVFNDSVTRIFQNEYRSPRSPFCSLAIPKQGIGGWCHYQTTADIDDTGLRAAAKATGRLDTPFGIPFQTPGEASAKNITFTTRWDNYPHEVSVPLAGKASRAYLLMAGSMGPMQCRFDNGEVVATYADGTSARLVLHSPDTWWPIEQDYFIDDLAFARPGPVPPRVDLKSGSTRVRDAKDFTRKMAMIPGGAATVLDLPLDPSRELKSLTVRTLGNEVVIGLMALTLARE